jgi:beta-ureidopropionase / N-carbamoyl-L-amino-acid hydrolase
MHPKVCAEDIKRLFDPRRLSALIEKYAWIGQDQNGGVTRLAFSREDREAREEFVKDVSYALQLTVRTDALGNMFVRREGAHPDWPVIMTGSHLDSVRNGGKFDGPAGVFCAIEAFRALDQLGHKTLQPFELAVFASEEPNTFGISTFGSRGLTGKLKIGDLRGLQDDSGQKLYEALAEIGGDLDRIDHAVRKPGEVDSFIELHIEQMPSLERSGRDIGIVAGVTGIYREQMSVKGRASHCGTTPMAERRDALCAAAEIILALEATAREEEGKAVATVGRMAVFPNSINITPELVEMTIEIRSYYPESTLRIITALDGVCEGARQDRSVDVARKVIYETLPTTFSEEVSAAVRSAAGSLDLTTMDLISMAGHDAAHMMHIAKAGMIFIPCRGGLSHCPEEWVEVEHLLKGAQCLLMTLLNLDGRQKG